MSNQFLRIESFEEVQAILETIKHSRGRYQPNSADWDKYVKQIYQAMGFSVEEKHPKIHILSHREGSQSPKAIAIFIRPGESLEDIFPGFSWETFMLYATSFHRVEWAIFTDGLQVKVVQFQGQEVKQRLHWQNFDQIICQQSLDEFLAIFMVFNIIKKAKPQTDALPDHPMTDIEKREAVAKARMSIIVREFLRQLLERAKAKTPLHAKAKLGTHNNFSVNAGKKGLSYGYIVVLDRGIVTLYIDNGDAAWNKAEFNRLFGYKNDIEKVFGEPLEWHLLPQQRSSYIRFTVTGYHLRNTETWDEFQDKLIDAMTRMEQAFRPYILG